MEREVEPLQTKQEGSPGLCTEPVLHELVHGSTYTEKNGGQRREPQGASKTEGEMMEKEEQLTARMRACSGKLDEDQSGRISPET
jgi:hypothetical protein